MTVDATRIEDQTPCYATHAGALDVAPHYRVTEVGLIPTQWRDAPLGEVATVRAGGTPHRGSSTYWGGDIPWVTTAEVNGRTITEAHEYITELGLARSAARFEEPGTVLVALYGQGPTRGRVATLAIRAATNQACAAIIAKAGLVPQFLFHFLAGSYERLRSLSNKGSQDNLSGALLRQFLVLVPPTSEQHAIAEALSDVDGLLGALEALISKKRAIKQAAMQQLLTGKTRLPGFSGEWETKRLGQIADIKTGPFGSALHERDYVAEGTPIITVEHLGDRGVVHAGLPMVSEADRARLSMYSLSVGDIVFSRVGSIDRNALIRMPEAGWLFSGRLLRVRPNGNLVSSPYLSHHFHGEQFKTRVRQVAVGQTMASLNTRILEGIDVLLPGVEEQTAIATVLSDIDAEIAALEARRDKTRAIKRGMMQQLLTGRVRLVKPEATA